MKTRFRASLCLPLLLAACEDRQEQQKPAGEEAAAPSVTKTARRATGEKDDPGAEDPTPEQQREALASVMKLPAGEERNRKLAEWIWDAFESDSELAGEGFAQLTPGSEERNRLLQHFAMRLTEQDPDQAAGWAGSLESEEEKSLAYGRIALVLAEQNPEAAARLLSESGVAGREFDVAVFQVIERWGATEPANAAGWVASFDAGETRQAGLKAITATWLPADPAACIAWISALQDETLRDEAMNGYAEAVLQQAPEARQPLLRDAPAALRSRFEELERQAREEEEN